MLRALTIAGLLSLVASTAAAACPSSEPRLVGGLKCKAGGGRWYQVEIYRKCVEKKGGAVETAIEIAERRHDMPEPQVRKTLPQSKIRSFLMRGIEKGKLRPQLLIEAIEGGTTEEKEVCGDQTRENLDGLTCPSADEKTEYRLELDGMCVKQHKLPMLGLLFVDRSDKTEKVRKKLNEVQARVFASKRKGDKTAQIMKAKAGRKGQMEAIALLRPDGKLFDWLKLSIAPEGAKACSKLVEIGNIWGYKWAPIPRRGFIEAVAIQSRDGTKIDRVQITISPMKRDVCNRTIDVSGIWDKYQ